MENVFVYNSSYIYCFSNGFEDKIGIPFYVSAWIGAVFLVVTNTISSIDAIKSIDMSTILLL